MKVDQFVVECFPGVKWEIRWERYIEARSGRVLNGQLRIAGKGGPDLEEDVDSNTKLF